ncbi:hypothetical protein BHE74_00007882 [Ensete ventricosum]|nr:hypothetical protein BHE74_00007882 [Ensete ventricosum]
MGYSIACYLLSSLSILQIIGQYSDRGLSAYGPFLLAIIITVLIDYSYRLFQGMELELSTLKKMSKEYAAAKELAISEAMGTVDIKDVKHIAEEKKLVGDMVDDIVKDWNAQKESFCQQTGINTRNDVMAVDEFYELEHLLNE